MNPQIIKDLPKFLEKLGLDEEPMGIFYTDDQPSEGFSPKPMDMPTREKEEKNEIDWQQVFGSFSILLSGPFSGDFRSKTFLFSLNTANPYIQRGHNPNVEHIRPIFQNGLAAPPQNNEVTLLMSSPNGSPNEINTGGFVQMFHCQRLCAGTVPLSG